VPRTGGVGSIGVIAVHVDRSAADAMAGTRYTTLFAGAHKTDFNPHEALGDGARSALQAEVDRVYGIFVDTVARNRGMSVAAVRATEARLLFGADAVAAGLADEIGTLREALAALATAVAGSRPMLRLTASSAPPAQDAHSPFNPEEGPMTETITETPKPGAAAPPAESKPHAEPRSEPAAAPERPSAEIVDLEAVRAGGRDEGVREAAAVAELCALAGMPERTGAMIGQRLSLAEVRKELLELRAEAGAPEVASRVLPGAGTGQPASLDDNPVVRAAKLRATRAKEA